jgi:hypothetical protein
LRDRVRGIIFDTMALAYPLLAAVLLSVHIAELPRKNRIAPFRMARSTAPITKGGPS